MGGGGGGPPARPGRGAPPRHKHGAPAAERVHEPVGVPDPAGEEPDADHVGREALDLGHDPVDVVLEVARGAVEHADVAAAGPERRGHVLLAEEGRPEPLGRRRVDEQDAGHGSQDTGQAAKWPGAAMLSPPTTAPTGTYGGAKVVLPLPITFTIVQVGIQATTLA